MTFKDYFSKQSDDYIRFRPDYPPALFDYLLQQVPTTERVLDCATGNGQAALQLANDFDTVFALDASMAQLQQAMPAENVHYLCSKVEALPIESNSLDLVTVAEAAHWFNLEPFYAEVDRILKPGGMLAVWGYHLLKNDTDVNQADHDYYHNTLGPYWNDEVALVENGYRELAFPYTQQDNPQFYIEMNWSLQEYLGYLRTWSATQHYINANEHNPLIDLQAKMQAHWPDNTRKTLSWSLHLLTGVKA